MATGKEIGERVAKLRIERGLEPGQLAAYADVSPSYISRLESGGYKRPSGDMLSKIAGALRVSINSILHGEQQPTERPMSMNEMIQRLQVEAPIEIPVVDQLIHAGEGAIVQDSVYLSQKKGRGRMLRAALVKGDCMEPDIYEGDTIIVDMDASPKIGCVVVALVNGDDLQVKRLAALRDGKAILECKNPKYPPQEVEDIKIQGVVISASREFPH